MNTFLFALVFAGFCFGVGASAGFVLARHVTFAVPVAVVCAIGLHMLLQLFFGITSVRMPLAEFLRAQWHLAPYILLLFCTPALAGSLLAVWYRSRARSI